MTAGDLAAHLGDAVLELTARRQRRSASRERGRSSRRPSPKQETVAAGERLARDARSRARSCCCTATSGRGRPRSSAASREGLGIDPDEVSSPTFTLIQEYRGGRLPLYHVDLYRLETPREVDDLGLDELAPATACSAIEWADRLPRPLDGSDRRDDRATSATTDAHDHDRAMSRLANDGRTLARSREPCVYSDR